MLTDSRGMKYPTSDGKPMGETDVHRDQIIAIIQALQHRYNDRADVYVTGNLLILYDPADGRRHLSPDVMVVFGVDKKRRENYKLWEEKAPDAVFEVTSASTRHEDLGRKMELYARLGIREYFIFDPKREYIPSGLLAYQLQDGQYVPIAVQPIRSAILGLELRVADDVLRLYDPGTGELPHDFVEQWRVERQRADAEHRDAEAQRRRADAEHSRAEALHQRAEEALRELDELRRKLGEQ
ncbi:MAG: Uma2 family endonuclease [Candidatus Xenobia bacterium]